MKKVAILQSNYVPWKGYFDLIAAVDEFIVYDDAQYTKNDWRNRNQIKTPQGLTWLTVPIVRDHQPRIRDARIDGTRWTEKHWRTWSRTTGERRISIRSHAGWSRSTWTPPTLICPS